MLSALLLLALAQTSPGDHFPLRSKLRAGFLLGNPLALSVATDLSEGLVLQLDVGRSPSDRFSAVIAMDVVYRAETVFGRLHGDVWLMPWFGFGMRGAVGKGDQENRYGFRVPAGLSLLSDLEPLELYVQAAVGLSAFPERRGSIDAGAGIRVGF